MDRYQLPTKAEEQSQMSSHDDRDELIDLYDNDDKAFCLVGDEIKIYTKHNDTMDDEGFDDNILDHLKEYIESLSNKDLAKVAKLVGGLS